MKKILSLLLIFVILLSLPLPAFAAGGSANSTSNDASLAFVLGTVGSHSTDPGEIVEGKRSIVGRYQGVNSYNQILFSNPDILPLQPNTTYTVTFKYRILEAPDKGFELLFYSQKGASLNDWVESSIEFKGKKGDQGKITLTATLKKYADYQLLFNIIGQGAIAIDSVSLAMQGSTVPLAEADFEEHGVVSFGGIKYNFPNVRTDYVLNITDKGTAVVHRASGATIVVPFEEKMTFAGMMKYSKDTNDIIHHTRSHMEIHGAWEDFAKSPVDWLRFDAIWAWGGRSAWDCIADRFNTPLHFPDQSDKVITAYVNFCEVAPAGFESAYNPAWDKDGDMYIDADAVIPDYVATDTLNPNFGFYMANYWTDSWMEVMEEKIDLVAAQHFDGIFLDVLPAHWTWMQEKPYMDEDLLKQREIELLRKISTYAKEQYGSSFLVTGNIGTDAYEYFHNLGEYLDGGYYQAFFFDWMGSGAINEHVGTFEEDTLNFLREQGLQVFTLENVGRGTYYAKGTENYADYLMKNYDDALSKENLCPIFFWAAKNDTTPYVTTNFMFDSFANGLFPRISRIFPGRPPFSDTQYDDWVLGSEEDDLFATGAGDDLAYGGPGDDEIYGGSGSDEAYYTGKRADYDIATDKGVTTVTAQKSNEGSDILIGFEGLIFSDATEKIPAYDISFNDVPDTAWFNRAVTYITAKGISAGPASDSFRPNEKLTRGDFLVMLMKAYGIEPDVNPADNFADAGNTYYTGYLAAAKRMKLSAGIGNNMYAPENQITRQELFTLLFRVLKDIGKLPQDSSGKTLADFTDAGQIASYATQAMKLFVETGTIAGSNGKLTPTSTTTRAEMAQVLYNLLGK